jgi:hypothetical protein
LALASVGVPGSGLGLVSGEPFSIRVKFVPLVLMDYIVVHSRQGTQFTGYRCLEYI